MFPSSIAKFKAECEALRAKRIRNTWVLTKDFSIFIRLSARLLDGRLRLVWDIANVQMKKPGRGDFWKLLEALPLDDGVEGVYVESILNPGFAAKLEAQGFMHVGDDMSVNMFKPLAC